MRAVPGCSKKANGRIEKGKQSFVLKITWTDFQIRASLKEFLSRQIRWNALCFWPFFSQIGRKGIQGTSSQLDYKVCTHLHRQQFIQYFSSISTFVFILTIVSRLLVYLGDNLVSRGSNPTKYYGLFWYVYQGIFTKKQVRCMSPIYPSCHGDGSF